MKLYAISGIGADKRAYSKLKINANIIHLDWIDPIKHETLTAYAFRLSKSINHNEPFSIIGVSFGGLVAREIAKITRPKLIILLSTVETKAEIPWVYKFMGKLRIIKFIPTFLFKPPRLLLNYFFNPVNKELLYDIIDDTDLNFVKWACQKLTTWKNTIKFDDALVINGEKDKLLPPTKSDTTITIKNGAHFMIVDKADEISKIINDYLAKL